VPARSSPTVRRRRLAIELRKLREAAGLTIQEAAKRLAVSSAKLSRIENAHVAPSQADVLQMLQVYGADEQQRETLLPIAREARQKGWWQARYGDLRTPELDLVGLETEATALRTYSGLLVPGLLQIPQYAEAILRSYSLDREHQPKAIDRQVDLRMDRKRILTQNSSPSIWAIIDEAALRRPVGGQEVMRQQLRHLTELAAKKNIRLQVLPFASGEHPGMSGAFTIIRFSDASDPDVVFIENPLRDLYLEEPHELEQYSLMFDHISAAAMSTEESSAFLERVARSRRQP
jgi:transcriptional regulator with XRE-family HTH domain